MITAQLLLLFVALCIATVQSESLYVSINTADKLTDALPSDFASFSIEVHCTKALVFANETTEEVRQSYVNLLNFLRNASGGERGPNLRIGGNSADESYYTNSDSTPLPKGDNYRIQDIDIKAASKVGLWDGTVTIDVNLRNPSNPTNSLEYVKRVHMLMFSSQVDGIEIGNEPELFGRNGIRPSNYNFDAYNKEWLLYARAIEKHVGLPPNIIQGAVFCCSVWDKDLYGYIDTYTSPGSSYLRSISQHHYPLNGHTATMEELMKRESASGVLFILPYATFAKKHGIPYFIGEGNSAFDGGKEGVSNTFASTLWSMDTMMYAALGGATRWNFHGCTGGAYTPVAIEGDIAYPRPLYYGMWGITHAFRKGAMLVNVTREKSSGGEVDEFVQVWATVRNYPGAKVGNDGLGANVSEKSGTLQKLLVMALHKNPSNSAKPVSVTMDVGKAFSRQKAEIRRLAPKSGQMTATEDISFDGWSFQNSTDGIPRRDPNHRPEYGFVSKDGLLILSLHPVSAVFVEVVGKL